MKKFALTITALLLVFSLTGCFSTSDGLSLFDFSFDSLLPQFSSHSDDPTDVAVNTQPTTQAVTDPTETEESTAEETQSETSAKVYQEITISESVQYRANIFLSNFSEQCFNEILTWDDSSRQYVFAPSSFVTAEADPMKLFNFCWRNIKVNSRSELVDLSYDSNSYYGIHIDSLNYTCERFFDTTLSQSQIPNGSQNEYGMYDPIWIGDYICKPAADGDTLINMTVADRMYDLQNGLYRIDFNIYAVNNLGEEDCIVDIGGTIHDKSVYYYTTEDAISCSFLSYKLSGSAIVRPYITPKGTDSYQLLSYDLAP